MELTTAAKIVLVIVVVSFVFAQWLQRVSRSYPPARFAGARLSDVDAVLRELARSGKPAFVAFIPPAPGVASEAANLKLSVDHGTVGLDWILAGPTSAESESAFLQLVESMGHRVRQLETDGVRILRAEGGDLVALCARVLRELCGVDEQQTMDVVVEGLDWRPRAAA